MSQRINPDKPFTALTSFAAALGWVSLRAYEHVFPESDTERQRVDTIVWYESGLAEAGRADLFLQINESPIGAVQTYEAAVYAPRFLLFTGWHKFHLTADLQYDPVEAERLAELLHHRWFESLTARRDFRTRHPECVGFSWKRIREVQSLR